MIGSRNTEDYNYENAALWELILFLNITIENSYFKWY